MTIDQVLDNIMQLDESSREILFDILKKQQVESHRDCIAENAKEVLKEFRAGNFTAISAENVIKHLDSL